MKFFHELQIDEPNLPNGEFEELCRLKPECRKPNGFRYKASSDTVEGDEFIRYAIALLKQHNVARRSQSSATHYGYSITRWYDEPDFREAELLFLKFQRRLKWIDGPQRDDSGKLLVIASESKPGLKFGSTYPENRIIVSDEVRKILGSVQLAGIKFLPMVLKGKSSAAAAELPWELDSTITLPKLANTHRLVHRGLTAAEPFHGDYSREVLINDEPFCVGELHYRRSELAAVGPFDIANTFEKVMWPHPLVISQRFYQHCLKNKILLEVEPVCIDPD